MIKCTQETRCCQVWFLRLLWSILFDRGFQFHEPPSMKVHHLRYDFIDFQKKRGHGTYRGISSNWVFLSLQSPRGLCSSLCPRLGVDGGQEDMRRTLSSPQTEWMLSLLVRTVVWAAPCYHSVCQYWSSPGSPNIQYIRYLPKNTPP